MKVIKGLVLGNAVKSAQEEKDQGILCYSIKLAQVLDNHDLQQSRREAGWILLKGLLHQGEEWLLQNIETIMMLFYSIFNKDISGITGFTKVSQILKEFDLKLKALESLHLLITKYKDWLLETNKSNLKMLS